MFEPAVELQSGATVLGTWTVSNVGSLATLQAFSDLVVIKNLGTGQTLLSTPVLYDQNASGNGPITPGSSRQRQFSFRLPDGSSGVGEIQATTTVNYTHAVSEEYRKFKRPFPRPAAPRAPGCLAGARAAGAAGLGLIQAERRCLERAERC